MRWLTARTACHGQGAGAVRTLVAFTLSAAAAPGAVAPPLTLEQLVDRSPAIIEAHVVRFLTEWDQAHKYIWTHYELQVSDAIRGSASVTTVSEPGGSLDGVNQAFTGSIGYSPGEHVLLFLFRTPIGYWRTTGGSRGKVAIGSDGFIHSNIAHPFSLSALSAPASSIAPRLRRDDPGDSLRLSDFKSLVRMLVESRAAYETR